jgi:glycosyltransferase involved in cell wall biosynthesis
MKRDLVSIIMISHDQGRYVRDSVQSVLAQTYQNWELLFLDDSSSDNTIRRVMELRGDDARIRVSQNVNARGMAESLNTALQEAEGRWIAFLKVGDLWEPEKLERQIAFMELHHYAFSYTKFRMIDWMSKDMGIVMGGIRKVRRRDLLKCCWMGNLTVMYDADVVGRLQVRKLEKVNDFALWLEVSKTASCYLLDECLASQRAARHLMNPFPVLDKMRWRYEVFHQVEGRAPIVALGMAIRNLYGGVRKKLRYAKRTSYGDTTNQ